MYLVFTNLLFYNMLSNNRNSKQEGTKYNQHSGISAARDTTSFHFVIKTD